MNNEQQPFDFTMPEAPQEPVAEAAPEFSEQPAAPAPENKFAAFLKSTAGKLAAIGAAVVVVVLAALLIFGGSSYKSPIDDMIAARNQKKFVDPYDAEIKFLNGFAEGEYKAIVKILKSAEDYEDSIEEYKEYFEESIDELKDEYGDNYKYSYKIDDKDKLDKDDLKAFEDSIQEEGKALLEKVKATKKDDFDQDEVTDEMGISDKDYKALLKNAEKIGQIYKKADVQEGYELDLTVFIKGSELDEPEEIELTVNVYKVNGKWISSNSIVDVPLGF